MQKSRSEVYREALAAYVARYDDDAVCRAYNELAQDLKKADYAFAQRAAVATLRKVQW